MFIHVFNYNFTNHKKYIYSQLYNIIMSATHKFELALHLKTLRNIGVRQTCFLQVRTIVFHKNDKK